MIFEPGEQEPDPVPPKALSDQISRSRKLRGMMRFYEEHTVEDFILLAHQPVAHPKKRKRTTPVPKRKGGGRPKEIELADVWIDFCLAMHYEKYHEARPLYQALRKALYS